MNHSSIWVTPLSLTLTCYRDSCTRSRTSHLHSRRRFQIHAGFIFEDMVRRDLSGMGFQVTDIKRINRKEFDVVATHGGVIYNFQCKNNWIDLLKLRQKRRVIRSL